MNDACTGDKALSHVRDWSNEFLNTKGVNTIEAARTSTGIKITQHVGEFSEGLRKQKILVGVFDNHLNFEEVEVWIRDDNAETDVRIPHLDNKFFLLNYGDHGYYRTYIEEQTSTFLSQNLSKIGDSLTRGLVWRSLIGMIKACKLKLKVLFDFIINNIPTETQSPIVKQILMISLGQIIEYAPEEQQESLFNSFFDFLFDFIQKVKDVSILREVPQILIDAAYKKENID